MDVVIESVSNVYDNILIDKDVQAWLKPWNLIDSLFICSKYNIRDNVISPNSFFYNIISVISGLILALLYFFCNLKASFYVTWEGLAYAKYVNYSIMVAAYFIGVILIYFVNIKQKNSNVIFALRIQRLCEIFKIHGKSLRNSIHINWIYVIALNCYHVFWVSFFHYAFSSYGFPIEELVINYFNIQFDISALHASRVMRLTWQTLTTWVEAEVKVEITEEEDNEFYWNKIISVYKTILETYDIARKSFQLLVSKYF